MRQTIKTLLLSVAGAAIAAAMAYAEELNITAVNNGAMTIGGYEAPIWGKQGWLTPVDGPGDDYADLLEQIKEFAAKLTDKSIQQYGICLRGKAGRGENMAFVETMVNTYGGRWFDMKWKPQLTS